MVILQEMNDLHHLPNAIQKNLISDEDFEEEKYLAREQKQKETEVKKQRKRGRRRKNAAKNKKFKRLKKAEIIK